MQFPPPSPKSKEPSSAAPSLAQPAWRRWLLATAIILELAWLALLAAMGSLH
jgi:hypothetical protein